jgi:hypothetical protein
MIKHCLFRTLVWVAIFQSCLFPNAAYAECTSCRIIHAIFSEGSLSGLPTAPSPEGSPSDMKHYRMTLGERYDITYSRGPACNTSSHATIGGCSQVFFIDPKVKLTGVSEARCY